MAQNTHHLWKTRRLKLREVKGQIRVRSCQQKTIIANHICRCCPAYVSPAAYRLNQSVVKMRRVGQNEHCARVKRRKKWSVWWELTTTAIASTSRSRSTAALSKLVKLTAKFNCSLQSRNCFIMTLITGTKKPFANKFQLLLADISLFFVTPSTSSLYLHPLIC